jgi:hypothetical protein
MLKFLFSNHLIINKLLQINYNHNPCFQINAVATGKDQLRLYLGHLGSGNTDWEIPFGVFFNLDELKPANLLMSEVNLGKLSSPQMEYFKVLLQETWELVSNVQIFQLLLLVN